MEELHNPCLTPPFPNDLAASQSVFSFPCLVENRCSSTYLLGRQLHGKVLGSCQHEAFFTEFMICSIGEASRNKMATVLCAVSIPKLCTVPIHFDLV